MTMRGWILGSLLLVTLGISQSFAQHVVIVSSCGTLSLGAYVGQRGDVIYMDATGNVCSSATGGSGGNGTSSAYGASFPATGTAAGAEYLSSPPTFISGNMVPLQTDVNGNLKIASQGTASVQAQAATSGGATVAIQSGLTTPVVVKASAGQIYKVQCDNLAGASSAWVELINASATPALGSGVLDQIALATGGTGGFALPLGEVFGTGISIGAATASNGGTAVSTAVNCSVAYK
jgi:hypothetical protein